jgi:hypothetical protein
LQKFLDFLGHKGNPVFITQDTTFGLFTRVVVQINSVYMVSRLNILGITRNKTWTTKPLLNLENDLDFWRGLIDGDGTIRIKKNLPYIVVCGTKEIAQGFADFTNNLTPSRTRPKITASVRNTKHYQFAVGGSRGLTVISKLYYKGCISLDRKQEIVNKILEG